MSLQAPVTWDDSSFDKGFKKYIKKFPEILVEAMWVAGNQIKNDADNIEPRTPHLEGTLKASGRVYKAKIVGHKLELVIAYLAPYAAKWHEQEARNWSEPGSGSKYLESKLKQYGRDYLGIIADYTKNKINGGLL